MPEPRPVRLSVREIDDNSWIIGDVLLSHTTVRPQKDERHCDALDCRADSDDVPSSGSGYPVLCLSFARNPVASIRVPLSGSDRQSANSRIIWAYIDPSFVKEQREVYQRALTHRSRGLVKPHENDSPFRLLYIAIFLAIAQHKKRVGQFYRGGGDDQMQRITLFVPNYSSLLQTTKHASKAQ
ncbi:hypothetical protein B0J14DRAFT_185028 [Halenospora varia]|nr:hypothetical protein B0J14DRAFT_185028 [Halenospora varia]